MLISIFLTSSVILFAQVPSYVPTNGLVGWWPFNGNAQDESGNGNNGTVSGPLLTTDRFGNANQAYTFDGVNDFIQITGLTSFNQLSGLTMSLWFKTDNYHNGGLIDRMDNNSGHRVSIRNSNMAPDYDRKVWGQADGYQNGPRAISNTIYALNTWLNITVCYSDSVKIYFNGNLESVTDINWTTANLNNLMFGRSLPDVPEYFTGQIDDICIWNRILSNCEIMDLYYSTLGSLNTYSNSTQSTIDSYTWPVNGQTYTQSGAYTAVIPNAAGCDSTITLNLTLSYSGMDEDETAYFRVYPNPNDGTLFIQIKNEMFNEKFVVMDVYGRIVFEDKLIQSNNELDISQLASGNYFIKVQNSPVISQIIKR